jgi:integrase
MLKLEGLPYEFLHLPPLMRKLPTVLSKEEAMTFKSCQLLKHKILIGLLYGCIALWEVRAVRLQDLDFDHQATQSGTRQAKDRFSTAFQTFSSSVDLKNPLAENPKTYLDITTTHKQGGDFHFVILNDSVQWAVTSFKICWNHFQDVVHTSPHLLMHFARRWIDIINFKKNLLGHEAIETTMMYLCRLLN